MRDRTLREGRDVIFLRGAAVCLTAYALRAAAMPSAYVSLAAGYLRIETCGSRVSTANTPPRPRYAGGGLSYWIINI